MKSNLLRAIAIGCLALANIVAYADESSFTGSYMVTGNVSTISESITSMNNRIGLNYKPSWSAGNFDYRAELYTETSFHTSDGSIVNEHKFETQLNYNHPLTNIFGVTGGVLYHKNNTFPDAYYWGIAGLTYSQTIANNTTATAAMLAEKRNGGGRVFYDASGSIEYHFHPLASVFTSLHRYENLGEFDTVPSRKFEYEIGANYNPNKRFFTGISYLHHTQDNDPDDRFALLKFKLGVNF